MTALEGAGLAMAGSAAEDLRPRGGGGRGRRAMPADFAQLASAKSLHAIKLHYRTNEQVVRRWFAEAGMEPRSSLVAAPADFAAIAPTMHLAALRRHYGVSGKTIRRWEMLVGVRAAPAPLSGHAIARAMPADYPALAPTMTLARLAAHYQASENTIRRWSRESGLRPRPALTGYPRPAAVPPAVGGSLASQAAHHLRRHYPSVYPAAVLPFRQRAWMPGCGKDMWVVAGKGPLSADAVIALARSKGFDPQGWARI